MKYLILIAFVFGCRSTYKTEAKREELIKRQQIVSKYNYLIDSCDSVAKKLNVEYWKHQCERVKHHNEVLPEEYQYLPVLSSDSCSVFFPL